MRKYIYRIVILGVTAVAMLASCNKTETDTDVYIDSYIQSIFNKQGVPVYNVVHTAYSYVKLSSVSVSGTSGQTIQLTNYLNNGFSFYTPLLTAQDSATYKTTVPAPDSYTYKATNENGEVVSKVDATTAASLMPAQQLNAVKNTTDIVLSWQPVLNVEAYKVRIYSEDLQSHASTLIFESGFLVPVDATSVLSIPFSLVSFSQYLSTNLIFEVSSFIFQSKQDTYQAVSVATTKKYFGN
jgi:hypothetical protein